MWGWRSCNESSHGVAAPQQDEITTAEMIHGSPLDLRVHLFYTQVPAAGGATDYTVYPSP